MSLNGGWGDAREGGEGHRNGTDAIPAGIHLDAGKPYISFPANSPKGSGEKSLQSD